MSALSTLNEQDIAILASKRLKQGAESIPTLMTYVSNGLNNLAREVANDPFRRRLLLTDRSTVIKTVTNIGLNSYVDLNSLISTYGIMLEYMQLGQVFYTYTLVATSVDSGSDEIDFADTSGLISGDAATFTTTGTLPGGISANTAYYIAVQNSTAIQIYSDPNDPSGSIVDITSTGSGALTMALQSAGVGDSATCQWLASAGAAEFDTGTSFPDYTYIWLVGNLMYTNRTLGTFSFTVPFIPSSVSGLPVQLEGDLVDNVVNIAITSGFEGQKTEAVK